MNITALLLFTIVSALLPQFIDPAAPQVPHYIAILIVFAGLDFIVIFGYAVTGANAVRLLKASAAKWLDRACGGALLGLAASRALYRRTNA